jgi:hypothetical protein
MEVMYMRITPPHPFRVISAGIICRKKKFKQGKKKRVKCDVNRRNKDERYKKWKERGEIKYRGGGGVVGTKG